MFAARAIINRGPRASTSRLAFRSFAQVVQTPSGSPSSSLTQRRPQKLSRILRDKVPVREDHGLWGFFRRKENGDELEGEAKYEVVEDPQNRHKQTGRSWKASELRLKSFKDLHTLWYILLRERNLLATQKEEARRMGISDTAVQVSSNRVHHTRKSMARIKAVLNERRLAYEGAVKIVETERDEKVDREVLDSMNKAREHKIRHMKKRQEYLARRLELKLARKAAREAAKRNAAVEEAATKEAATKEASPEGHSQPQRVAGLLINS
ncbi:54S ribosomal protein L4, mitochondrial [Termitomyces sp. J132]|nr:hypothetical protein H2248_007431 [Termitomyces sp. 'cryptogamus']KNZ73055.1 54S ribosomal protein L4, mitochondrial [Termitomyces sp. J132]